MKTSKGKRSAYEHAVMSLTGLLWELYSAYRSGDKEKTDTIMVQVVEYLNAVGVDTDSK